MNAIYSSYLTEEERAQELEAFNFKVTMNKLDRMYEMVCLKEATMIDSAELKVFTESGTYDDLATLTEAADNEAAEQKAGIISKIISAIKGLINKIIGGIKGIFDKGDPEEAIEVDKGEYEHFSKIKTLADNAKGAVDDIKAGRWSEAAAKAKTLAGPVALASSIVAAGVVVTVKHKDIKAKVDECDGWLNMINGALSSIEEKIKNLPSTMIDLARNALSEIKKIPNAIGNWIAKMKAKITGQNFTVNNADASKKEAKPDEKKESGEPAKSTAVATEDDVKEMKGKKETGSKKLGDILRKNFPTSDWKRVKLNDMVYTQNKKTKEIVALDAAGKETTKTKNEIPEPIKAKFESAASLEELQAVFGTEYYVESTATEYRVYKAVLEDVNIDGATDIYGYNLGYDEAVATEAAKEKDLDELRDLIDSL